MIEKVGIISDIHGNYYYLKKVIEQLLEEKVTHFIFLGDMITDFPYTKEIIKLIRNLEKLYKVDIILGNREKDMIRKDKPNWDETYHNGNLLLAYNDLSDDDIKWLEQFSEYKIIEFPNKKKALISHYSNTNEVKNIITNNNIDTLIFGHSHREVNFDNRKNNDLWYINPGSIGLSEDGICYGGTYGILYVLENDFDYEQRKFIVDRKTIDKICQTLNNDEKLKKSHWNLLLYLSMQTGRNMCATYFGEVQRLTRLYSEDKNEKIKNKFYTPLNLEQSLTTGYNYDIYNNPLKFKREYQTLGSKTFINEKDYTKDFDSNMKVLDNPQAREEIYKVALNNTLYYASCYEKLENKTIDKVSYKK